MGDDENMEIVEQKQDDKDQDGPDTNHWAYTSKTALIDYQADIAKLCNIDSNKIYALFIWDDGGQERLCLAKRLGPYFYQHGGCFYKIWTPVQNQEFALCTYPATRYDNKYPIILRTENLRAYLGAWNETDKKLALDTFQTTAYAIQNQHPVTGYVQTLVPNDQNEDKYEQLRSQFNSFRIS